jgi:hypothetical protein
MGGQFECLQGVVLRWSVFGPGRGDTGHSSNCTADREWTFRIKISIAMPARIAVPSTPAALGDDRYCRVTPFAANVFFASGETKNLIKLSAVSGWGAVVISAAV